MLSFDLTFLFVFGAVAVIGVFGRSVSDGQTKNIPAIIGGDKVDIRQYPHQVAVLVKCSDRYCGGSIISEEYVLTAAHCIKDDNPETYEIRVGSTHLKKDGLLYGVSSITKHPKYIHKNVEDLDYDIAVLKVSGKIAIDGETSKIIKLAESGSALKPGDLVTVSGWGANENCDISKVLRAVTVPVVDQDYCTKAWKKFDSRFNITERNLCAGFKKPGRSACSGDSGGALIGARDNVQYGIMSFLDLDCHTSLSNVPNVYVSIPALRDWIKQTTGV